MKIRTWIAITATSLAGIFALATLYLHHLRSPKSLPESSYDLVAPDLPTLQSPAILVFDKTNGFVHHEALPAANAMLTTLARRHGWSIYRTDNAAVHSPEQLARFAVVVWNNVSGDVLTLEQRKAFRHYLENGGGFVGLHAAGGDWSYRWEWYADELIRAQFIGHPMFPQFQEARLRAERPDHPLTSHLPVPWTLNDEWYSFAVSPRQKDVEILLSIDEDSYSPKVAGVFSLKMGADHPLVWKHCVQRGRAFYSALGHQAPIYQDRNYSLLIEKALIWAGGLDNAENECQQPRPTAGGAAA